MMKVTFGLFLMVMMMMVIVQSAPIDTTNSDATYKIVEHGFLSEDVTESSTISYEITCGSEPKGTHPDPVGACKQISNYKTSEDFNTALLSAKDVLKQCDNNLAPVVIVISGTNQGNEIEFQHFFPNHCVFKYQTQKYSKFVALNPSEK